MNRQLTIRCSAEEVQRYDQLTEMVGAEIGVPIKRHAVMRLLLDIGFKGLRDNLNSQLLAKHQAVLAD